MRFTWDPVKSATNLRDRGFNYAFASLVFRGRTHDRSDLRRDYGEERRLATGRVHDVILTVCYTDRTDLAGNNVRRIISARRSNRHERQTYRAAETL